MYDKKKLDALVIVIYNCETDILHFRFTVLSSGIKIPNAIGLARFEDRLFWADDTKMGVLKVDKYGDEDPQQIFQDQKNKRLRSIKVFHQSVQHQKDRKSRYSIHNAQWLSNASDKHELVVFYKAKISGWMKWKPVCIFPV